MMMIITFSFFLLLNASSRRSQWVQLLCSTRVGQRAHNVSRQQVAVGGIVSVVVMSEEAHPLSTVVVFVPEDLTAEIDRDVISTLFELRLNVQESFFFFN